MTDTLPGWLAGWIMATPPAVPMIAVYCIGLVVVAVVADIIYNFRRKDDNDQDA